MIAMTIVLETVWHVEVIACPRYKYGVGLGVVAHGLKQQTEEHKDEILI